ncbi:hypothetical protein ACFVZD_48455 [Streptomyces sp. NPDC058287]|uniref:hypothetical protein n=1 Tax=Streptomyces sp. NPDC058287 TaxID=3346423 RepID=UPI0036E9AE85
MDEGMFGPVAASPTRADLIESGVLIDVPTPVAHAAGLAVPVAFSARAWKTYGAGEEEGQLLAVLSAVVRAIAQAPHGESLVVSDAPTASGLPAEQLHAEMHPGDALEPVLTLLLPTDY